SPESFFIPPCGLRPHGGVKKTIFWRACSPPSLPLRKVSCLFAMVHGCAVRPAHRTTTNSGLEESPQEPETHQNATKANCLLVSANRELLLPTHSQLATRDLLLVAAQLGEGDLA